MNVSMLECLAANSSHMASNDRPQKNTYNNFFKGCLRVFQRIILSQFDRSSSDVFVIIFLIVSPMKQKQSGWYLM